MRDYYKEMEEIQKQMEYNLNPMKKIQEEMEAITNPMKTLMDSQINLLSMPHFTNPYEELQKKMDYALNPMKKLQEEMDYALNPMKKFQEEMELISNPFKNLSASIEPMRNVFNSLATSSISDLNKILKELNISSFKIEDSVEKEIEEQIESLKAEDKKALDEIMLALKDMFPEIDFISKAFSKKQYVRTLTYIFIVITTFIYNYYQEQQKMISDSYYKINRNKVRVRTEPSSENPATIIMKLNKNVFVEKIDSHKNWLKIEFENDNGEEIEGWVRRDMVVKIEED